MRAFLVAQAKFWLGLLDFCHLTLCLKVFSARKKFDSDSHEPRGPRERPKMVGIGKSGFESASYAEFSQEHDQHLTLDVWWPNHE